MRSRPDLQHPNEVIEELRYRRRFDDALVHLIKVSNSKNARDEPLEILDVLRHQLLLSGCLVLEWAQAIFSTGDRSRLLKRLDDLRTFVLRHLDVDEAARAQLAVRLDLIEAFTEYPQLPRLEAAIRAHVAVYGKWWDYSAETPSGAEPSRAAYPIDERIDEMLKRVAAQAGPSHPGLLMASETIRALRGREMNKNIDPCSWIMFALRGAEGLAAQLTLEPLAGHYGILVPDPYFSAYFRMTRSFHDGFGKALQAAQHCIGGPVKGGRWCIKLDPAILPRANHFTWEMHGRSAEGTLACALIAATRSDRLDRNTCMSAAVTAPNEHGLIELGRVEGLDAKLLAKRLDAKHIRKILVSAKQSGVSLDVGSQHDILPLKTLDEAIEKFSVWPSITRAVKCQVFKSARGWRREFCQEVPKSRRKVDGYPYVPPPVAVRCDETGSSIPPRVLSPEEYRQFVLGKWPTPGNGAAARWRVFAGSGLGKSALLVACEEAIARGREPGKRNARGRDDRVPVRIGKTTTTDFVTNSRPLAADWAGDRTKDLTRVLKLYLNDYIPDRFRKFADEWILRMADLGNLVFLIDGLDQSSGNLSKLATFLRLIPECPVIVAGRPETVTTRQELFSQEQWQSFELQPFDESRQRRYLGSNAARELIADSETMTAFSGDAEVRRDGWRDLLKIPLLLKLMKELATPKDGGFTELERIRNRYALYRRATDQLLLKGVHSLEKMDDRDIEIQRARLNFRKLALAMTRKHCFSVLEGESLIEYQSSLGEKSWRKLIQIGMHAKGRIIEQVSGRSSDGADHVPGLEWRHRSFLEYFAGCAMAELWNKDRSEALDILRDVHAVLDDEGKIRLRARPVPPGRSDRDFRDLRAEWQWILRFMLAHADDGTRDEIAVHLISLGNAWIVYDAVQGDRLAFQEVTETVCRWLVRPNSTWYRSYEQSLYRRDGARITSHDAASALATLVRRFPDLTRALVDPGTRDAGLLPNLREITTVDYQSEFDRPEAISRLLDSSRWYPLPNKTLEICDFPVTNLEFESFCASHRRSRDQHSSGDDHPVIDVSWWMAVEFARWLSDNDSQYDYDLPSSADWELACTWGESSLAGPYWWGERVNPELCWHQQARTRSRSEAIAAVTACRRFHPSRAHDDAAGLLDLLGNVWEWCHRDASSHGLRGGSWRRPAKECRIKSTLELSPDVRAIEVSFRLCRKPRRIRDGQAE